MKKKLISILLPVYNAEQYIVDAIDSVLKQTYKDFELIIINDGSTDHSEKIILSYHDQRIKYIKNQTNLRLINTLNKGIEIAKGEFIARMDADDIVTPTWLEIAMSGFEDAPYASLVNQLDYEMDVQGTRYWKRLFFVQLNNECLRYSQLLTTQILHPGIVIKSDVLKKYKYRNVPEALHREDFDLWKRLLKDGHYVKVLNNYVLYHRRSPNSITATGQYNIAECVKAMLDDIKEEGYIMQESTALYILGCSKITSYKQNILVYNELIAFVNHMSRVHFLVESDQKRLHLWIDNFVTNRALHKCHSFKGICSAILYLVSKGIYLKKFFWCNIFALVFHSSKKIRL